ncbi:hypothetical protein [Streptomyces sp. SID8352]|uniref:hypothetical protein n=1 Tax=Streptomyces sp. SID8352 TaxID=2690338 RepID=UPI00136BBC5C
MSSARRPLLTAAAAGGLLCALWFVPSANATPDGPVERALTTTTSSQVNREITAHGTDPSETPAAGARMVSVNVPDTSPQTARLADTGSFDSTPYVVGGTLCLGLGAGFVVYSMRRERLGL